MKIRAFKLKTGEEIIGRFHEETSSTVVLEHVRVYLIAGINQQTGELQVQVIPYSAVNPEAKIRFVEDHLCAEILEIPKEIEDSYLHQTSGIEIASGKV